MSGQDYLLSLLVNKTGPGSKQIPQLRQKHSPFLKYHHDTLTVKYIGRGQSYSDIATIQSNSPASLENLIFYYEVKINYVGQACDLSIGFAESEFPENKHPGLARRSIGYRSDGKVYYSKTLSPIKMPAILERCYIGCGINYFRHEIFFTYNGQYFGPAFRDIEIQEFYPTVGLHSPQESVTFNFGDKPFKFNLEEMILEEKKAVFADVLEQNVDYYTLHQIIYSYLNFYGYAETLKAFEKTTKMEGKDIGMPRKEIFSLEEEEEEEKFYEIGNFIRDERIYPEDENEKAITEINMKIDQINFTHKNLYHTQSSNINPDSPLNDIQEEENGIETESSKNENTSIPNNDSMATKNLEKNNMKFNANNCLLPEEHETKNNQSEKHELKESKLIQNAKSEEIKQFNFSISNSNDCYLNERAWIRNLIIEGKVQESIHYITEKFPGFLEYNIEAMKALRVQMFIEYIKSKDIHKALECAQKYLVEYKGHFIFCFEEGKAPKQVSIDDALGLMCYIEPETSNLKNYLTFGQRDLTADIINKSILSQMGYLDKTVLEVLISQLIQVYDRFQEIGLHFGETFEFKI